MSGRWFALIVLSMVVGCGGNTGDGVPPAGDAEDLAVAAIKALRGEVTFDEKPPVSRVYSVDLTVSDDVLGSLKHVLKLPTIQKLTLSGTDVRDASLPQLAALKRLRELKLDGTKITDAGVRELVAIESLETLDLLDTKVTDACVSDLGIMRRLRKVYLGGTKVTEYGKEKLGFLLPKCKIE